MKLTRRHALLLSATPLLAKKRPRLAVTIDDIRWPGVPGDRLLTHLGKTSTFLFAIGEAVDNPEGARILETWSAAGHRLGNHTWSHKPLFSSADPAAFEAEILRTDALLQRYSGFRKVFRFPALKEGQTPEIRDRLRSFLRTQSYRNGAVSIDASDWYYDQCLRARLRAEPAFDATRFREPYLDHIFARARYCDQLSRDVLGRSISHTLLLHYNLLNSLFLGDLLAMFRARGWEIIDAEDAYTDPVFTRQPDTVPAGESLLWALAKATGRFESRLRYPGEGDTYEKPVLEKLGLLPQPAVP